MTQERDRILDLLASGRITAEEAGRLLDAGVSSMAGWVILPRDLDLARVRAVARAKLTTLRRLSLGG